MSMKTGEQIYNCRNEFSNFFNADGAECVIWQPNCTQALNTVIKGCLKAGDHVVISDLEHNAAVRPLKKMGNIGVTYTVAKTYPGDNDKTIDSFRKAITPITKLVLCIHGSNVFGIKLPIERIAALAHFYGAKICVDCAQSAGVVPIDMKDGNIDYLCIAGHKGLYGPMGTGALIMRAGDSLETLVEGGTGTQSRQLAQPADPPERYESGTQNIPGIIGLTAGLKFVKTQGVKNIHQKEMSQIVYLYDALKSIKGVKLYTPRPTAKYYLPVLSFNVKDVPSEEVGAYLAKSDIAVRCGLHCAPLAHDKMGTTDGTVRVSPSIFTKKNELDILINKIHTFIKNK